MGERLRLAARLTQNAHAGLLALIQGEAGEQWRRDLQVDMAVMKCILPGRLGEMASPQQDPSQWERLWQQHPGAWKSLVSAFIKKTIADEKFFVLTCARFGVQLGKVQHQCEQEWMCGICGVCFGLRSSLTIHQTHAHKVRDPMRARVSGTECPSCGVEFWSRLRLRGHLKRGRKQCTEFWQTLPLLSVAEREAEDEKEREEARRAKAKGMHPLSGPPARKVHKQDVCIECL